jgi:hypothetical protein
VFIHDPAKYEELLAALGLTPKPDWFVKNKLLAKQMALNSKSN